MAQATNPTQAQPQAQQLTQFATNKQVLSLHTMCNMKIAKLAKEQIEQNERNEQLAREQITQRPRIVFVGGKARAINNLSEQERPLQVAPIARQNSADTSGPSNQVEVGHPFNGIFIEGRLVGSIPDHLIEGIEKSYHVLRSKNNFEYAKKHLDKYEKNFFSDDPIVNSIIIGDDIACKALLVDKKIVDKKYLRHLVTTAMMTGQSNIIHLLMSYIPENERAAFVTSKNARGLNILMLPIYVLIDPKNNEYGAYEIPMEDQFYLQRRMSYPHCKINSAVITAILSYIPENERVDFIKNLNLYDVYPPLQFFTRDGLKTLLKYIPENERENFVTIRDSSFTGQMVFPFQIYKETEITEEDLENMLEVIDELINCIPENKREILIRDSINMFDVNNPISLRIVQKFLSYIPEDKREDLVLSDNPIGKSILWYFTVCGDFKTISWLLDNVIKNINRINIFKFLNQAPNDQENYPGVPDQFINLIREMVKRNAQLGHLLTHYVINPQEGGVRFYQIYILLDGGVSIDSKDFFGYTALMTAARLNKLEEARFFIEHKANLDERDSTGSTALHFAAASGFVDITQALLAAGADASIRNNNGKTALDLAKDANMIRILTDHIAHK